MRKVVNQELHRSGIYAIENKKRFVKYVGQSVDIANRWKQHISSLEKNRHFNPHLQNSWSKYGRRHFEFSVLEFCDPNKLDEREQYWIDKLRPEFNIVMEVKDLSSRGAIEKDPPLFYDEEEREIYRPDWHKYVYGGAKREG